MRIAVPAPNYAVIVIWELSKAIRKKGLNLDGQALSGLAGGPGFEPELTVSETVVLPLDDPPNIK